MPRRPLGRRPKRPFRRPLRGPNRRPGLRNPIPPTGGSIPPVLMAAHQLVRSGNYKEAGKAYYQLAEKGIERNHRKAPMLYFQAARCYFMLGDLDKALKIVRKAIDYFGAEKRWADMYRGVKNSAVFLNGKGYSVEANTIESWAKEYIPSAVYQNLESIRKEKEENEITVQLPTHCPTCGGLVNPKEIEWVDDTSAVCEFCGSVVREE